MRVSVDENESIEAQLAGARVRAVYLNGVEIRHVITADDELGYVKYYPVNVDGEFPVTDGLVETREAYGTVRIEFYD